MFLILYFNYDFFLMILLINRFFLNNLCIKKQQYELKNLKTLNFMSFLVKIINSNYLCSIH